MTQVKVPICPNCGNDKEHYLTRQTRMVVEDTLKPKNPLPPGAGITHPAFELAQFYATTVICRKCGIWFSPVDSFHK